METAQPMVTAFKIYLQIPSVLHRIKRQQWVPAAPFPFLRDCRNTLSVGGVRSESAQTLYHPFPLHPVTSQVSV